MRGWIGVDFDGTLVTTGDMRPVWPMIERVKQWLAAGQPVKIMTARACKQAVPKDREIVVDFCIKHFGKVLPVTNEKDFGMLQQWDDKAVPVVKNTGMIPAEFLRTRHGNRVTHTRRRNGHA